MKAEELRIGNLLMFTGQTVYVLGIHQAATLGKSHTIDLGYYTDSVGFERHENDELLSGIPLSPEWLERFGAIWPYEDKLRLQIGSISLYHSPTGLLYVNDSGYNEAISEGIEYVHQLQNLYFALTGKELELKQ